MKRPPAGVTVQNGGDPPGVPRFDLQRMQPHDLLKLLGRPNVWWRRQGQRVLNEKFDPGWVPQLEKMALDTSDQTPANMHALWLLISQGNLDPEFHLKVIAAATARIADPLSIIDGQRLELLRRLRDAQRAVMAEPARSDAWLLLEGIVLRLQADLRWLEACEGTWTERRGKR